jgi:hypothetical protein
MISFSNEYGCDLAKHLGDSWDNIQKQKIDYEEKICKAILRKYGYPNNVVKYFNHGPISINESYVNEDSGLVLCEIKLIIDSYSRRYEFRVSAGIKELIEYD